MMEIIRTKDSNEATEKASLRLNGILDAHAHVPTLLLLSGGSSFKLLDNITVFPPNFTVGMTDERFSQDLTINNFAQMVETSFFTKAQDKGSYFIDTRVQPGEYVEIFAKRFEDTLLSWRKEHPGGRIVITQGVGSDGHTVGIMPYAKEQSIFEELFERKSLVVGYDAQNKSEYPLRATITLSFLRMVDHSVLYMVGKEKKKALSLMLSMKGMLRETPARIIHEMKEVHIFTDIYE